MPPMVLMFLPFDVALLRVTVCFLEAINAVKEAFEEIFLEKFWAGWEGDLEYGLKSQ